MKCCSYVRHGSIGDDMIKHLMAIWDHEIKNPYSNRMEYSRYILTTEYSVQRKNGTIVNPPWTMTDKTSAHSVTYPNAEEKH